MPVILAIDQSTSATKALLFDHRGGLIARSTVEHQQFYPQPGFVEHDAEHIIANVYEAIAAVMAQSDVPPDNIAHLSITNQRETVVVWDKMSKKPITRALVWQDQRGAPSCERLKSSGAQPLIQERTGLIIDSYFSATKIQWALENIPDARAAAERGHLLWGTIDSWIIWNLTAGKVHATDYSNACRTMLFDIHSCRWDSEILEMLGIPGTMCPEALPSDAPFGTAVLPQFPKGLPIRGVMGDSHAALFGQCCFKPGMAKATYGTGSSIMVNIGNATVPVPPGLVHSIAWAHQGEVSYVLEGNIHTTGDLMNWLRDNLAMIKDNQEAEQLAASLSDSAGVFLVPAFNGLGSPYWRHDVSALITGMTRTTTREHIVRAALEAIAYQVNDVLGAVREQIDISELRTDGGPSKNKFLMQFQADLSNIPIVAGHIEELSALGVAYLGGIAGKIWRSTEEIGSLWKERLRYTPAIAADKRARLLHGWKAAIKQTLGTN